MPYGHHLKAPGHQHLNDLSAGLAFPRPCAGGTNRDHRLGAAQFSLPGPQQQKLSPQGIDLGRYPHHILVGHITVRKNTNIDPQGFDQLLQLTLMINGYAFRIKGPRQISRIHAPVNVGNLGRRKGNHLKIWIIPEIGVEIMKIPSGSADDNYIFTSHRSSFYAEK